MKKNLLHSLLSLLLLLGLAGEARAATPPPTPGRPLAEALNPDGTLKAGLNGSFDARAFRMRTAPDGRPVFRPAGTAGAGDERWQSGFGVFNGADGSVDAVVSSGTDIYIGGSFTVVGNIPANGVAKWNGSVWSPLGTGVFYNNSYRMVSALGVAGNGDVYAGGIFTQAGGIAANNVAKWNGSSWAPLGTGTSNGVNSAFGVVYALTVTGNGDVYVGGNFTQAGGIAATNVARWNGTAWNPLSNGIANGVNTSVYALAAASNGDVYVGGVFTQAGGIPVGNVAKWNNTTAWSPLGTLVSNGVNGVVSALAVAANGDVYVGGIFNQAGVAPVNNVAKWSNTAWNSMGNGVNERITGLAVAGSGEVYASGVFTQAGGVAANKIARWSGTAWNSVGTGTANGMNGPANALVVAGNGDVYTGGLFMQAGGIAASRVARWNSNGWSPLSIGVANGMNASELPSVYAVAVAGNGDVYVGGYFSQAGGIAASNVAKWNGSSWSPLGTGVATKIGGPSIPPVYALAVAGNGDVYVGGNFIQAGGIAANSVAKWNGTAWSPLGTGVAIGTVRALAVASNGDVYAGGNFARAGGITAYNVAKWNGSLWSPLGTGTSNGASPNAVPVNALVVAGNGDVYVGGDFTHAGGVAVNKIAKWDGTVWSALGIGVTGLNMSNATVTALAVAGNGNVYAGGNFTQASGVLVDYVARWNGSTWNSLGPNAANGVNGLNLAVSALTVAGNGDVYVGGSFTQAGAINTTNVARWNGTAWSPLGTGTNARVLALALGANNKLYTGGLFTTTGDGSKAMVSFGVYDPNAPLATAAAAARAAPAAQLFPNPAHGTATLRLPAGAPRRPLTLTDALGRIVRRYPAPAGPDATLDLRGLPAGVYVVGGGPLTQRLVVE